MQQSHAKGASPSVGKRIWQRLRALFALVVLLVLAAIALPWLVPEEPLQRLVAARLTALLGRPVEVQGASLHLLPTLEVHADALDLGTGDARLAWAEDVHLYPDPLGWPFGHPLRHVAIQRAAWQPAALLAALSEAALPTGLEFPSLQVAQLAFDPAQREDSGIGLNLVPLPNARWQAKLSRGDEDLILGLEPAGKSLLLNIEASQWTLPASGGPVLTQITGLTRVADGGLALEHLRASLGTGQVRAVLRLERTQDWRAKGALTLEQVSLGPILDWAGIPLLHGNSNGTLYLEGTAGNLTELAQTASLSGHLVLGTGKLLGLNLATPATRLTVGEYRGEDTVFDGAQLVLERQGPGEWLLTLEALQATNLTARGLLRVSAGALLDGTMEVRMGDIGAQPVPLLITGTISAPRVRVAPETLLAVEPQGRVPSSSIPSAPSIGAPTPDAEWSAPSPSPIRQPRSVTEIPPLTRHSGRPSGWLDQMDHWWSDTSRKPSQDTPARSPKTPQKKNTRPWILDYQ